MAFSAGGGQNNNQPMSEINVTPLVDVMLVLLIIFMITAPLMTHKIPIDLPQASTVKNPEEPNIITLALTADGNLYWNDIAISKEDWKARIEQAATQKPQPELQLRADKITQYQVLAEIMADAQNAGINKMGFITTPVKGKK
ncbi:ExbD/TolR family protein [Stenotrophobium rhamnosiphilum]|uniref:Biopolymer transporter ExbD n=1 Tax=Stenotrophobium rhamnosiphilum TaxID=2029166 RepID=A0A2T5MJE1_9GAMM|nr:biopolymer transporter ExbD [Stenotrophobium rhamnosiphilum]PTU32685.1 biopolymer transporter ExbD [Stenotrophobium rhamnosiphilum]